MGQARPQTQPARETWVLYALDSGKNKALSPVQLQKALFLLGEVRGADVGHNYFRFSPYHYGPFDAAIYDEADRLAARGLVHIESAPGSYRMYRLTEAGAKAAEAAFRDVPPAALEYLRRAVAWVESLSFDDLIRAIYKAFPKMAENSVFRD